jgi:hypothetical protein
MKNEKSKISPETKENITIAYKVGWREGCKVAIIALLISLAII